MVNGTKVFFERLDLMTIHNVGAKILSESVLRKKVIPIFLENRKKTRTFFVIPVISDLDQSEFQLFHLAAFWSFLSVIHFSGWKVI